MLSLEFPELPATRWSRIAVPLTLLAVGLAALAVDVPLARLCHERQYPKLVSAIANIRFVAAGRRGSAWRVRLGADWGRTSSNCSWAASGPEIMTFP
jgi:hypothetical protein